LIASRKDKGHWSSRRNALPGLAAGRTEQAAWNKWSACPDRCRLPIRRRQKHRDTSIAVTHAHLARMDTTRSRKGVATCGSTSKSRRFDNDGARAGRNASRSQCRLAVRGRCPGAGQTSTLTTRHCGRDDWKRRSTSYGAVHRPKHGIGICSRRRCDERMSRLFGSIDPATLNGEHRAQRLPDFFEKTGLNRPRGVWFGPK
jgi:hypothetical protein